MHISAKVALGLLLLFVLVGAFVVFDIMTHGISTRREPHAAEAFIARRLRHLAVPLGAKQLTNPLPASSEVLAEAREHFADHCASCHGNDGRGKTEIGRNLYPKAPDMTLRETQRLADGELFYIIKHGVRFTGMPAWGADTPEDDRSSWQLVRFLRHLPTMTSDEMKEMEAMNPVSPSELKERQEENQFLEGDGETAPKTGQSPPKMKHH